MVFHVFGTIRYELPKRGGDRSPPHVCLWAFVWLFQMNQMCESVGDRNRYRAGFHDEIHLPYEHSDQTVQIRTMSRSVQGSDLPLISAKAIHSPPVAEREFAES